MDKDHVICKTQKEYYPYIEKIMVLGRTKVRELTRTQRILLGLETIDDDQEIPGARLLVSSLIPERCKIQVD